MAPIKFRNRSSSTLTSMLCVVFICWIIVGYIAVKSKLTGQTHENDLPATNRRFVRRVEYFNPKPLPTRTLIVYVFANTHISAEENMRFFIRTAVHVSHNADYYFILQRLNHTYYDVDKLPKLPSNAHYIQHENKCFDLGTIGWFLASGMIEKTRYRYFVFVNSSVRGPFIVSYYNDPVWYTIFTGRLNHFIRLTGCSINCDMSPHVQSYLWAMELNTVEFLLNNTSVFECHQQMVQEIADAEVVASRVLLQAGYGIDSLMTRYQGLDFRYNVSEECLPGNPTIDGGMNGVTFDPYEVVFVKIKFNDSQFQENRQRVLTYEKWM